MLIVKELLIAFIKGFDISCIAIYHLIHQLLDRINVLLADSIGVKSLYYALEFDWVNLLGLLIDGSRDVNIPKILLNLSLHILCNALGESTSEVSFRSVNTIDAHGEIGRQLLISRQSDHIVEETLCLTGLRYVVGQLLYPLLDVPLELAPRNLVSLEANLHYSLLGFRQFLHSRLILLENLHHCPLIECGTKTQCLDSIAEILLGLRLRLLGGHILVVLLVLVVDLLKQFHLLLEQLQTIIRCAGGSAAAFIQLVKSVEILKNGIGCIHICLGGSNGCLGLLLLLGSKVLKRFGKRFHFLIPVLVYLHRFGYGIGLGRHRKNLIILEELHILSCSALDSHLELLEFGLNGCHCLGSRRCRTL